MYPWIGGNKGPWQKQIMKFLYYSMHYWMIRVCLFYCFSIPQTYKERNFESLQLPFFSRHSQKEYKIIPIDFFRWKLDIWVYTVSILPESTCWVAYRCHGNRSLKQFIDCVFWYMGATLFHYITKVQLVFEVQVSNFFCSENGVFSQKYGACSDNDTASNIILFYQCGKEIRDVFDILINFEYGTCSIATSRIYFIYVFLFKVDLSVMFLISYNKNI